MTVPAGALIRAARLARVAVRVAGVARSAREVHRGAVEAGFLDERHDEPLGDSPINTSGPILGGLL